MKTMVKLYCFCALLWCFSSASAAFAAGEVNPNKILTATDIDTTVVTSPNSESCDFGVIDPIVYDDGSDYSVSHEFTFINHNKDSVVINEIRGSDFRVQYDLPLTEKPLPAVVPPDGIITFKISYHLLPLFSGRLDGSAKVFIEHQVHPVATLRFTGVVQDAVTFDPPVLDFGEMKPGQITSKSVKITYDPHMFSGIMPLPPEQLPHITSTTPFISVKQTKIGFTSRADIITMLGFNAAQGPGIDKGMNPYNKEYTHRVDEQRRLFETLPPLNNVVTCLVTVKAPAVIGAFRGFVVIVPVAGTPGTEVLEQETVAVQGEVTGN